MNWKTLFFVLVSVSMSACTPDAYQHSADLQVNALLKDRETQTLGYTPQVSAEVKTPNNPTEKSYEKLPVTIIPPPSPPPVAATILKLPYEKLGPTQIFPPGTAAPTHQALTPAEARRPAIQRLKLGPPPVYGETLVLDIFQSIEYAVQHSRDYQSRMEDLYLATLDVTLARHAFEPRPFAQTGVQFNGNREEGVGYRSALNVTNSAGVRQQLPYGGEIVAQGLYNFVSSLNSNINDGESAQVAINATIPLLRGAGMTNLESLISSERSLVYAVRDFEVFRRQFVVNVASQYINLLSAQQNSANGRFNYILAYQNKEQSYALYAAGRSTNFQSVQRADTSLLRAENEIISRDDRYQSSLDNFKILIGMPVNQPLDVVSLELDVTRQNLDADFVATALKYRLELQTARDRVEDSRRGVDVSKNGLLPDLDFTAGSSIGNLSRSAGHELDSRNLDYNLGVTLDLPLDRLAERNAYRRSLISLERSQRSMAQTQDQIISQVRNAVRSIRTAEASLEISRTTVDAARQWADYSNQLLILGRSTNSQDSVDAQNQLLTAQDSFEQARANYQIQVLSLLRDTGTLRLSPDAGKLGIAMERGNQALMDPSPRVSEENN